MNAALVDGIVKAVLYEGYMLYPYRPSAVKNRQRFNFGVVYPRAYSEAQGGDRMRGRCKRSALSGERGNAVRGAGPVPAHGGAFDRETADALERPVLQSQRKISKRLKAWKSTARSTSRGKRPLKK